MDAEGVAACCSDQYGWSCFGSEFESRHDGLNCAGSRLCDVGLMMRDSGGVWQDKQPCKDGMEESS